MDIPIQRTIAIYRNHIRSWEDQIKSDQISAETAEMIGDTEMKSRAAEGIKRGLLALSGLRQKLAELEGKLEQELKEAQEL